MCIGLSKAQDTTTGKGVAAALTPFVICCGFVIIVYALIFGTVIAAAAASSRH